MTEIRKKIAFHLFANTLSTDWNEHNVRVFESITGRRHPSLELPPTKTPE